ncbi:MAG: aspartyl/asparaginyl beta-hydroxylase domain-containing protein [Proteobacteria bacterium]|nr:aspartyl/asparaginyl beta-hydroxylase domain-containing protein [Pseudomonadota bacterium]
MDIDTPIKCLGSVEIKALQHEILSLEENAWHEQEYRQQEYDVHRYTESIVMIFTDGSGWPNIEVSKQPGWDRLADVAVPVMHHIVDEFYPAGGTIIRAMAAKLLAGGIIKPHVDTHPSFRHGHRIHVPITTNHRVRFMIDGRPYQMEVGQAYEINNQKRHSVMNKGDEDRVTFIFDYVPPEYIDRTH